VNSRPRYSLKSRIASAVLLALAPLLLLGGLETHLGHGAPPEETTIFADASHVGQADHWEAADTVFGRRCQACLAPAQPQELAPKRATGMVQAETHAAPILAVVTPPDPGSGRSSRPRAPPSS
jgi:hypothetical protein